MKLRTHDLGILARALLALTLGVGGCGGGGGGDDGSGTDGSSSGGGESSSGPANTSSTGSTSEGTGTESSGGSSSGGESSSSSSSSAGSESSSGSSSDGGSSSGGETGGASLPDGFEETLSESGCADMIVYASDAADGIGLVMYIDAGLVANAASSGETYQGTHAFDEFQTFSVLVGTMVTAPECNDVITEETVVEQEWVATAGSVTITIEPVPDAPKFGTQGIATLELTGVEVTYGGATETLEDITLGEIAVGWLPG